MKNIFNKKIILLITFSYISSISSINISHADPLTDKVFYTSTRSEKDGFTFEERLFEDGSIIKQPLIITVSINLFQVQLYN